MCKSLGIVVAMLLLLAIIISVTANFLMHESREI